MNKEFCKKCLLGSCKAARRLQGNKDWVSFIQNQSEDYIFFYPVKFSGLYYASVRLFKRMEDEVLVGNCRKRIEKREAFGTNDVVKGVDADDIQLIDQNCSFYMEHCLYDWNKKPAEERK